MKKLLFSIPILILAFLIIRYFYHKPDVIKGDIAPDFSFTTLDGRSQKLSDLHGKVVLLDFWGSWCGPCRKENPQLIELYKNFGHTDHFDLVSIGIETNINAWSKAIAKDGLLWKNHFTEGKGFDSDIAKLYGITSIPTKLLIDTEGHIVHVNPSFDVIHSYLAQKTPQSVPN